MSEKTANSGTKLAKTQDNAHFLRTYLVERAHEEDEHDHDRNNDFDGGRVDFGEFYLHLRKIIAHSDLLL